METRFGRRTFVYGAALAAVAAPFLTRRPVRAGGTAGARRLVVFFSPNGTVHQRWRPSGSGGSWSFPAGSILEPLASVKRHLVVLDGVDFVGASNHEGGMAAMLTGSGDASHPSMGMSVDQYVARAIGGDSRLASLELGVQTSAWGGNVQTRMSYAGPGRFVPPDDDPASVYRRLFGSMSSAPGMVDAARARRQSVLDLVRADVNDLRGRVGAEERRKLDAHLESLRRVETSLDGPAMTAACAPPTLTDFDHRQNERFPEAGDAQMRLLLAALSCGATRVASIQWAHTVAPQVFSWIGQSEGHHALSHMGDGNAAGVAEFVRAERWFAERFAWLVGQMAELPEPGGSGSMLDHSLVVWAKEMGDSRLHDCISVPFVLAGSANGRLATDRYLRLDHAPHQKLLVSICHAMGLDNPTFGDPSRGAGPLSGLLS
ncbi:MAG: DUF1552 domain-containing protein [Polyangiales bacterium]